MAFPIKSIQLFNSSTIQQNTPVTGHPSSSDLTIPRFNDLTKSIQLFNSSTIQQNTPVTGHQSSVLKTIARFNDSTV